MKKLITEVPDEVHEKLKIRANNFGRSLTKEVMFILKDLIEREDFVTTFSFSTSRVHNYNFKWSSNIRTVTGAGRREYKNKKEKSYI
jgi:plasmid stability protein